MACDWPRHVVATPGLVAAALAPSHGHPVHLQHAPPQQQLCWFSQSPCPRPFHPPPSLSSGNVPSSTAHGCCMNDLGAVPGAPAAGWQQHQLLLLLHPCKAPLPHFTILPALHQGRALHSCLVPTGQLLARDFQLQHNNATKTKQENCGGQGGCLRSSLPCRFLKGNQAPSHPPGQGACCCGRPPAATLLHGQGLGAVCAPLLAAPLLQTPRACCRVLS